LTRRHAFSAKAIYCFKSFSLVNRINNSSALATLPYINSKRLGLLGQRGDVFFGFNEVKLVEWGAGDKFQSIGFPFTIVSSIPILHQKFYFTFPKYIKIL
jgi:hypothetical protein